ncbi:ATP-binding cassette domain-containing protein [Abiotrophia sp.]|uniref:ATP-binding cassette domain-containing protein n=1 Tax=Abiotrophia sp. TaxID=76631 RepID=UPI001CB124E4|nr:ABC transporter ATP-binding protein [Abiotrophia sp.]MBF0941485.1 ABC transporter ATP-binding protein [Abiotrophia sp.]
MTESVLESVLEVSQLTKIYKKQRALDSFDLSVSRGEIVGIIGPNGAGKSTLLRSIVGLTPASEKNIQLFGSVDYEALLTNRHFVGALIEAPAFVDNMSAKKNMIHYALQRKVKNRARINEVLTLVGLDKTGNKKVKNFSLGMKQRLAIALTLLHDPDLLILDEPINGLDPAGIIHVRELLLKLNREKNMTILISSHILSELEHLATRFVFVNKGRKVADISSQELAHQASTYYQVQTTDNAKALDFLGQWLGQDKVAADGKDLIAIYDLEVPLPEIAKRLVNEGFELLFLGSHKNDLESVFLNLTEGGN